MSASRSPRPPLTSSTSGSIQYEVSTLDSIVHTEGQTRRTYQYPAADPRVIVVNPRAERTSASSRHSSSSRGYVSRKGSSHSDGTIIIDHTRKHDPRVVEMHQHTRNVDEENAKLREHIAELSSRNDQLEQELQYLQESRFQRMTDARYTPMEDSRIQHELETLRASITRTGKRYALTEIDPSSSDLRTGLQDLHEAVTEVASTSAFPDGSALLEAMADDVALPRLLYTAMLSWFVHHRFLQNPFFFANRGDDCAGTAWAEFLNDALSNGWRSNSSQANIWRSDTLRHLFPSSDNDRGSRRLHTRGESLIGQAAQVAAGLFAQGPARLLLQAMSDAAQKIYQDELVCVFEKAARLSITLWRERLAYECHYVHDLATERFSIDSEEMQAHARHLLDDPTDHRLDGRRVRIVVHPSVIGLGTHDGDRYQTMSRVLVKAVVCLDEASGHENANVNTSVDATINVRVGPATVPAPMVDRTAFVRSSLPLPMAVTDMAEDESDRWWSLSSRKDKKKKKRPT